MPVITLPDGNQKQFDHPVTVLEVAQSIGAGLAKATLAGYVNDKLVDASFLIESDAHIKLITIKDPEGLDIIRHSTAHLLAQAVKQLFPEAQVTIGPVIEEGFYYDFAFSRPFTPEDLERIEVKMRELIKKELSVQRKEMPRDEAIEFFKTIGEHYKAEIISDIPQGETISLYEQGDFIDLCRGPHVPNTNKLDAFKLMKVAGAYWRGDSKNTMLQRIYGTAWGDKKALDTYLHQLEEAEKRDHRKISKALDLFHLEEESPGMVFWHPKGWTIYREVEQYIREKIRLQGYDEVRTPVLVNRNLLLKTGHVAKFDTGIFATESENHDYLIKPMNCPCHVLIFNQGLKSYRDLPLRFAEFGCCHRNEPSGALHGIMRVRGFTQDDAHIFCTDTQVEKEASAFIHLLYDVYRDFGFEEVMAKLSTRPEKRAGSDEVWDKAEAVLANVLKAEKIAYDVQAGEGAFYGPKIEFSLKDCMGRVWQCGTLQLDYFMAGFLGAEYVSEEGSRKTPVMLHRAILGSLERFLAILIEHHAGFFPLWLSPVQAMVMNITEKQASFVENFTKNMQKMGIRATSDLRNEKIGFKIREHTLQRVPYLLVVGDREVESNTVSVRTRAGQDLGSMSMDSLLEFFQTEISKRSRS